MEDDTEDVVNEEMQAKKEEEEKTPELTIQALEKQLKEQKDQYLRLLAEMENTRKRLQKERQDSIRFAVENVIVEFLTPLDNFENALSFAHQTSEETQSWAKGFEMILTQFKEILTTHNIYSFESAGIPFDPHMHEVIEMEETEKYREGVVMQEFIRGYKCGKRILRPARVKVAKGHGKEGKNIEEKPEVINQDNQGETNHE